MDRVTTTPFSTVLLDVLQFPVYIADAQTLTLLYVNPAMVSRSGAAAGQACYQAIYQQDSACSSCRIKDMIYADGLADRSVVFEYLNEIGDRCYQLQETLIAWSDSRVAKISIAVDITVSAKILAKRSGSFPARGYRINSIETKEIFDDFEFDLDAKRVAVKGQAVSLTLKEFELGLLLFQHLSRALSRGYILDAIWKQAEAMSSRTIDTHISMLRQKLGLRPENGYRLATIYRYGYRLERVGKRMHR